MMIGRRLSVFALALSLSLPACGGEGEPDAAVPEADAQPEAMAPQQQMDPEAMALMMEAQQIQQDLAPIREQAMQDEALSDRLRDVQQRVETAMRDEAPGLLDRMDELEAEFVAAQEAGDQERVQEIAMEAQGVQGELQEVQGRVLDRPDIREPVEAFEQAQRERMVEIDPQAGELLDRLDEIIEELELR